MTGAPSLSFRVPNFQRLCETKLGVVRLGNMLCLERALGQLLQRGSLASARAELLWARTVVTVVHTVLARHYSVDRDIRPGASPAHKQTICKATSSSSNLSSY